MAFRSDVAVTIDDVIQQLHVGRSLPTELLEIFAEEADDHLRTIYDGLNRLQAEHGDMTALADVRRSSHTLKGAAGAVNLVAATRLAHRMEDLLDRLAEHNRGVSEEQLHLLLTTADHLQDLTTGDFGAEDIAQRIVELYRSYAMEMGEPPIRDVDRTTKERPDTSTSAHVADATATITASAPEVTSEPTPCLRVPLDRLDSLVGLLGEMIITRSEFQHRLDDFECRIEDMHSALERLRNVAQYVEGQYNAPTPQTRSALSEERYHHNVGATFRTRDEQAGRQKDDDPLGIEQYTDFYLLAQTLSEANNDAEIMSGEFRKLKTRFDSLLRRQQQLAHDAQAGLMRIRMVPLAGIVSRLERTVRTVASRLDRQVELDVVGERIELDKTVLDEITDSVLHLIRNAIDHGVEHADVRAAAGKPETARLCIQAVNNGTQVILRVSDDGAGINLDKVREKAIHQGLISEDQELSSDELHSLIFLPGFSTAAELTDVSGRGVGMDVVSDAIRRLKGTIRVHSSVGIGTTFTIQLPTTLGTTRALLVDSRGNKFAIPMQSIQRIQRLDPATVVKDAGQAITRLGDRDLRLIDLATHLQLVQQEETSSFAQATPMLLLGDDELAVTVDIVLGSRDIVVKPLGDHLKKVRGIVGATIGGDGEVIPILDTTELVEQHATDLMAVTGGHDRSSSEIRRNVAMVVDDSISVRRVTETLLQLAGWDVVTAKDGVDALETLAELDTAPDILLCDMEMPRMDGIEMIRQIREQPEFELTPIVMVTSRASEKLRHKAFEAGATDYVVKPYHDEQLLELVVELVQSARETVSA